MLFPYCMLCSYVEVDSCSTLFVVWQNIYERISLILDQISILAKPQYSKPHYKSVFNQKETSHPTLTVKIYLKKPIVICGARQTFRITKRYTYYLTNYK